MKLAFFLPLGIALVLVTLGFTDVSSVFILLLRASATLVLIEPASASPLPSALHVYPHLLI